MEWKNTLADKYPKLYRNYGADPVKSCMAWGFSVGDGWRGILEELSAKITALDPKGFVIADQVKEKFGGLRFYYHVNADDANQAQVLFEKVEKLVGEASGKSYKTCEECGKPGDSNNDTGWIKVLCDDCQKRRGDR